MAHGAGAGRHHPANERHPPGLRPGAGGGAPGLGHPGSGLRGGGCDHQPPHHAFPGHGPPARLPAGGWGGDGGAAGDADLRAVDRRDPGGGGGSAGGGAGAGGDVGGRADPQLFSVPPRSRQPGASLCAVVVADGGTKASGVVVRSPCPFPALPCRNRPRLPALLQGAATRRRVRQTHSSRNSPGPGWIALASSRPSLA